MAVRRHPPGYSLRLRPIGQYLYPHQLRYDLRKLKAHGLLERIGRAYCYRLTDKGVKAALMFILFHKRVCGPLANSLFHHRPDENLKPASKVEAAYYKADRAIQQVLNLLAA